MSIVIWNVIVSASVISLAAWLSGRYPSLAGFVVALPLATMLVLPLSQLQHGDGGNSIALAKSIFVAVPITLMFFVPFLLSARFGLSFWQAYGLGTLALVFGYFAHGAVMRGFGLTGM